MTQTIEQLTARVRELEEENELLKGRKNVELAANTDNAKSKQQRELAGPMEMGQLLAGSTHKTSGDLEIERTKPVTWIHKGGGFISDSRGKFIGCFSGDFRYRDRIICAVNSESETSKQLAAAQEECEFQRNAHKQAEELMLEHSNQLAAEQLNNKLLRDALEHCMADGDFGTDDARTSFKEGMKAIATPSLTEALDKYVAEKVKDVQLQDIEQYRLQMAGISTAAIGYWKEDDSIHPDYDTPALRYVAKLYANYESRTKQRDLAIEWLERCAVHVRPTATIFYEEIVKAINAIKESDGMYMLAKDRSR